MTAKKTFYSMMVFLGLLCSFGLAVVVFGSNLLQKEASKLTSHKLDNAVLEQQQVALIQATKDIEQYNDLEQIAKAVVPQDKDQARTVREIVQIANDTGIRIASITFPASSLGQQQNTSNRRSAEGGETSTATPSQAETTISQVKPVEGLSGVFQLEINVQSDNNAPIPYSQFIRFLEQLEQNRRTAQVSNITVEPNNSNRDLVTFSLVVNTFIKP